MKKITFVILLIISFFIMSDVMADTTYIKGTINAGKNTNVYSNPSTSSSVLRNDTGYIINLNYPETFEILSEENDFYKIYFQYSSFYHTGYIPKNNSLVKKEIFNIEDTTVNNMRDLGFDDTYAYKLAVLKTINTHWEFIAVKNVPNWNSVISGETSDPSKNLLDSSNTALRSTVDEAYQDGEWKNYEPGWFAASVQTVKYYMDPRNFLNEGHILMFEQLDFNEKVHTNSVIDIAISKHNISIFPSAFKCNNKTAPCNDQIPMSYREAFIEAAKKSEGSNININPIHMIARINLEQGWNFGTKVNGNHDDFPGYYNFFNINAYAYDGKSALIRALEYARTSEWNSPYATIKGGAKFLYDKYTNPTTGQDTNYFQKFNVINSSNYYRNQYMQNIRAPYTESYSAYKSYYEGGVIQEKIVFKIPVYDGMPAFTSLSSDGNEDATLKYLNIPGCYLMPTFTPSALNYNCSVNKDVASVNVSAEATNTNAVVSGIGNVNLTTDSTTINVVVTAAAGNTRTYNIVIKKIETSQFTPDEIISRLGININSKFLSGNNIMTTPDNLITLIKSNFSTATVSLNNKKIGTGTTLTITNNGSKTYNLVIYGDNTGDGVIDILDLLTIQKHLLNSAKISDSYLKASDVNKDGKVDILDLLTIQKYILGTGNISQ
ncbi:MAG: dockerin type I domain-containing protein [Bacilli bacterium]|nr:dockerin type I domain-containing protein [Bacilli bacterium]